MPLMLILVLVVMSSLLISRFFNFNYIRQKDRAFSQEYNRAIANALSCREVAMARLTSNYLFRVTDVDIYSEIPYLNTLNQNQGISDISRIKCKFSITSNTAFNDTQNGGIINPRDLYIDIVSTGLISTKLFGKNWDLNVTIKSTVLISYTFPIIKKTQILYL